MKHTTVRLTILFLAAAWLVFGAGGRAYAQLTAKANHDHIEIDFGYHGSTVSVRGVADPDVDLVVTITSPETHQRLKQKGKTAGFLWMNVGTLEFEQVPNLYFVSSTGKIEEILDPAESDRLVLGYKALEHRAEVKPADSEADKARWFAEFIRYKEKNRLFAATTGRITRIVEDGQNRYYTIMDWPYQAPPGVYTATVYAVKNGKVVEQAESKVLVEQVGMVKKLADMARSNAALYGVISILIALSSGFGVGMIFRKGGGAH